jgi:hypothetical protein
MARILAVDWSGARDPRRTLWLAEAAAGRLTRLEGGRTREQLVALLVAEAAGDPELVVGLDFAFSFPAWFVRELGARSARDVWTIVAREGERWLRDPQPPFWRARKPAAAEAFRRTEREIGGHPKSVFQLVGVGQVGTGSLRGMPALAALADAGFRVWPFEAGPPLVVEIYPTALRPFLAPGQFAPDGNPHAFDAAASALVMARHEAELLALAPEPEYALEGRIWRPAKPVESPA